MTELASLSMEQLQERLSNLDAEWHAVQEEISLRSEQEKHGLVDEIIQKITESGYSVADVVAHLRGGRGRARAGSVAKGRNYAIFADPDNASNTYSRGPLPGWLKDKMAAAGMDPADKEQRETFKQQHLKRV